MRLAKEMLADEKVLLIYERFRDAREAAIIKKIRQVCGISPDEDIEV